MNRHPSVMFEIMACDQEAMQTFYSKVFGWTYRNVEAGGFSYIDSKFMDTHQIPCRMCAPRQEPSHLQALESSVRMTDG